MHGRQCVSFFVACMDVQDPITKRSKLRRPNEIRFNTLILLLQPSVKPLE